MQFIEKPVTKRALSIRRPVYGVGVNDAHYMTNPTINGKKITCPFYAKWTNMLTRCYSEKYHERQPTYIGCSVCDDWLVFSRFKLWMKSQEWEGKHLDKDLLNQGNKVYSPETCIFISRSINALTTDCRAVRGAHPRGVCFDEHAKKYAADVSLNGKSVKLGHFDCPLEASRAYKKAKYKIIKDVAILQPEPLKSALLRFRLDD